MPEVVLRITAIDLASAEIKKTEDELRTLQRAIVGIREETVKQFGEWAGTRAFVRGKAATEELTKALGEANSGVQRLQHSLGELNTAANLDKLGFSLEKIIQTANRAVSVTGQMGGPGQPGTPGDSQPPPKASQSIFVDPGDDRGAQAFLDNIDRENRMIAEQTAELKRQYDAQTEQFARRARAQKDAADKMIENLRRYNAEEEKAYRDRMRFQQQVAPQSSIADQQRFLKDIYDNQTAAMERQAKRTQEMYAQMDAAARKYIQTQNELHKAQEKFASQIAPQSPVRFDFDATGKLKTINVAMEEAKNKASELGFKLEGLRHLIAIFDEFERGQRGAMFASGSALLRDTGLMAAGIAVMTSAWAPYVAAGVAALAVIGYWLEQQYQRMMAIRELQASLAIRGFDIGPQTRINLGAEFDRAKEQTKEFAGTERQFVEELQKLPPAAMSSARAIEELAKGISGITKQDPKKVLEELVKSAEKGPTEFAKVVGSILNISGALDQSGMSMEEQAATTLNLERAFQQVIERANAARGGLLQLGRESRAASNSFEDLRSAIGVGAIVMGGSAEAIKDLNTTVEKGADPLKNYAQSMKRLSAEMEATNAVIVEMNGSLDKQIKLLDQYNLVRKAAETARGVSMEGEYASPDARLRDLNAEKNAREALRSAPAQPWQEQEYRERMAEIDRMAKARDKDLQTQKQAALDRLEAERKIARERMSPPGREPPADLDALVENSERVMRAKQAVADADARIHHQDVSNSIAAEQEKLNNFHLGTAERLAAQDEIIRILDKEVKDGVRGEEELNAAKSRRASLARQYANEEFAAFKDAGRAEIEQAKDNAAKINEIWRGIWQKAIDTGQTKQAFNEITREWIRDIQTARQRTFEEFSAGEREKIEEARGDWKKIMEIYQEWADFAAELFGQNSKQFAEVERSKVKAAHQGIDELNREAMRYADAQVKLLNMSVRQNQLEREARDLSRNQTERHHDQVIRDLQTELHEVQSVAEKEMALYAAVANAEGIKTEDKLAALEKEAEASMRAATQEMEIAKKITEEQKKAAEESRKVWTDFFKKTADDFGKLIGDIFDRKPGALTDFISSMRKNIMSLGENLLAKMLGKQLGVDVKAGEGMGGLLSGLFGKLLGLDSKDPSKETSEALKIANQQRSRTNEILQQIQKILDQQKSAAEKARDELRKGVSSGVTPPVGGPRAGKLDVSGLTPDKPGTGEKGSQQFFSDEMKAMFAAAAKDGIQLSIGNSFRDFETQTKLFAEAVKKYGSESEAAKHVARPGTSMHEYGLAADLRDASGHLVQAGSRADAWLAAHAGEYGIGRPMSYEPWHVQPLKVDVSHVGGAATATPQQPGALPTSAGGRSEVNVVQSIPLDVRVISGGTSSPSGSYTPVPHSAGGYYPTSMPMSVKRMLLAGGRWSSGPAVNDNMGGMLHIVHPGEMIVPADVMGGLPSSQGGMYDQIGTESRGFQKVAMVPVQKGLGKMGWLLYLLGGIGAIAGLSFLFGGDDDKKKQQQDALYAGKLASDNTIQFGTSGLGTETPQTVSDLSPLAVSSSGKPTTADTSADSQKSLFSGLNKLTDGVGNLAKDMGALSGATTGATAQMSPFAQGLNMLKTVTSTISSVMSIPKTIGSMFSGIGSIFSGGMGLLGLFGLNGGGIIPSAAGGMITPRLQGGGMLSILHPNEMVLPSHISQLVQNAANNNMEGGMGGHTVNFHINTIDARSGAQFLMNNADTIARAYARSYRSYSGNVPRS